MVAKGYRVYAYRWVVLATFMFINLTLQMLWISFAAITEPAASFYGVSTLQVGLLAMIFMIIYIPLSIPAAWAIDTYGLRRSIGLGALLLGGFGLLRGAFAGSFSAVLACTIGVAVAQPLLLNAVTALAARWFPIEERATASGLALVAVFLGIALGMAVTPVLAEGYGIVAAQRVLGLLAALSAAVFLALAREAPPTPPCPPGQEGRALVLDGLKRMLRLKEMWILLFVFLVGQGIFNGISTWIGEISAPRGFSPAQAGVIGACLLLGGIAGAALIPALSDRTRRRKIFLVLGLILGLPGLIGMTLSRTYPEMIASAIVLGFFLTGLAPVAFQYAAEITYPAPEGTSLGLLNLAGQASVVFVFAMQALRGADGSYRDPLILLVGLMALAAALIGTARDSTLLRERAGEAAQAPGGEAGQHA